MNQIIDNFNKFGYAVIPNILSDEECDIYRRRLWKEYIEKVYDGVNFDDKITWKDHFPLINKLAIFSGSIAQTQVLWDIRQHSNVKAVYSSLWNTNDLIVSMDGTSLMCPNTIKDPPIVSPWPHVDQNITYNNPPDNYICESDKLTTGTYIIQGQVLLTDSLNNTRGFWCYPESHLRFNNFIVKYNEYQQENYDKRHEFIFSNFNNPTKIKANKGSMIIWDSRTIHYNQWSNKESNDKDIERLVVYVSYIPRSRSKYWSVDSNEDMKTYRKNIIDKRLATGHNPLSTEIKDDYFDDIAISKCNNYIISKPIYDENLL